MRCRETCPRPRARRAWRSGPVSESFAVEDLFTDSLVVVAGAAEWAELAVAANGDGADEPATLLERYLTQVALVTPADGGADCAAASRGD